MTTVHLIAGFLGAGKTSVLLDLVARRAGERVAVLVNDFGTAAIDAGTLGGVEVRAIAGGCVCCTAPAGFTAAMVELVDAGFERIFVEPTGLAVPADLIDTLRRLPRSVVLGPLVVVVDPHQVAEDPALRAQAEVADVLVVNRTDLASDAENGAVDAWISAMWPGPAQVVRTTMGRVPDTVLDGESLAKGPRFRAVEATDGWDVRSATWAPDVRFARDALLAALAAPGIARAKGIFRTDEGVVALERSGDTVHEAPSGWRRDSRVDVISRRADAALDAAMSAIEAAILSDVAADAATLEVALPGRTVTWTREKLAELPGNLPDVGAVVPGRVGVAAPLAVLLAGAPDDADVVVVSADGFTTPPTPIALVRTGFLAHTLDGGPLPGKQGGPFRLLLPGGVASPCANVKSVVRIRVRGGG